MPQPFKKILVIGLDGAPFDLVSKWTKRGLLPNLAKLIQKGSFGVLDSRLDLTPPAWSSIYTGKNAGKHGIFDFMRREKGTYSFVPINSTFRDSSDIWEILSRDGLKVGILNAPVTFPPRKVNGFMVSGFLTPGTNVSYTFPEALKDELKSVAPEFGPSSSDELQVKLRKDLYVKGIEKKLENIKVVAKHLLSKYDPEFFLVVASETDHVQHWFWDAMDDGENGNPESRKYSEVILNTYRKVDQFVGELIESVSDDTLIAVISDHGGARLKRFFHTNYFLHNIGLLNFKNSAKTRFRRIFYKLGITHRLYQFLLSHNVYFLRYVLLPITLSISDIDWERTQAFSLGSGAIYLNLKGRERFGVVDPENYEVVRKRIVSELLKVKDPQSASSPVEQVYPREELFSGPHLEEAPDLILLMKDGYEPFPWSSIAGGVFTGNIDRSGTHSTSGIILLAGRNINAGSISNARVTDVAPTLLYALGHPIPSDMDGKVLVESFDRDFQNGNPVNYTASTQGSHDTYELSEDEQEKIEDNLRSLGYI